LDALDILLFRPVVVTVNIDTLSHLEVGMTVIEDVSAIALDHELRLSPCRIYEGVSLDRGSRRYG
jgi:hypothetical protein